MAFMSMTGCNF